MLSVTGVSVPGDGTGKAKEGLTDVNRPFRSLRGERNGDFHQLGSGVPVNPFAKSELLY